MSSSPAWAPHHARAPSTRSSIPLSVAITKRALDLIFSCAGLLLLGPLLPFLALAIYLDSPGPIFYRQRRAAAFHPDGQSGRIRLETFWMLKFRTMRVGAEALTGAVLAQQNDPRVTRLGTFLRKTRLDELPQLWNVLIGNMSLIGPRPERPELLENLSLVIPFFEERMRDCKPGITGLAQTCLSYSGQAPSGSPIAALESSLTNPYGFEAARGALADDMRTKLLFDLAYVAGLAHFSTFIVTELRIILLTPFIMLRGLGR